MTKRELEEVVRILARRAVFTEEELKLLRKVGKKKK